MAEVSHYDSHNQIVRLIADNDIVTGKFDVQGILFVGSGTGQVVLKDGAGDVLAKANLVAACLTHYIPLNRIVIDLVAETLNANQSIYVYLRKEHL